MKKGSAQVFGLLFIGLLLAVVVNCIHPHLIPWVQDWDHYAESRARDEGIEVISLRGMLEFHERGTHLFVDARSEEEFEEGHIAGALSLPFDEMEEYFEALEQVLISEIPLVVYCTNSECDDALYLAIELRDMGVSNLAYFVDGYDLWKQFL